MADYAIPADDPSLFPDEGYGIVVMDTFKAPDDKEFIQLVHTFDNAEDVVLPPEKMGYFYYVHTADGSTYSREEWPPDK